MSNNKEREQKVKDTLEMLRSYLQADGGDISFVEITDDLILKVELLGACGTCPFSLQTLKNGVEQAIRKEVPEIKEVVAINM
ncbi:MAG: NifU family protein [Bacteroidales bacterium]|jgi:Fe-S cluster biogenesis protein NfuA|nr:NifU family protein [Bacteroidales bacterium]